MTFSNFGENVSGLTKTSPTFCAGKSGARLAEVLVLLLVFYGKDCHIIASLAVASLAGDKGQLFLRMNGKPYGIGGHSGSVKDAPACNVYAGQRRALIAGRIEMTAIGRNSHGACATAHSQYAPCNTAVTWGAVKNLGHGDLGNLARNLEADIEFLTVWAADKMSWIGYWQMHGADLLAVFDVKDREIRALHAGNQKIAAIGGKDCAPQTKAADIVPVAVHSEHRGDCPRKCR